jgi:hypothetical protein
MRRFILAATVLSAGICLGIEENDHRGSLGLTIASGPEISTAVSSMNAERGVRIPIELGGTLSFNSHNEIRVAARLAPGIPPLTTLGLSFYGGLRNTYGLGLWKTFFDIELAAHVMPFLAFGVRGGFGVQYDFLPIMGAYAQVGAQIGGATSLRLSFEVLVGVQFRTYLFEP